MRSQCISKRNCKIISVQENGMKFTIENNSRFDVDQIKVDGCLIEDHLEKCDWAFRIISENKVLYVELKGADIKKAISQLESTINKTDEYFKLYNKECYIVSSRVPALDHDLRVSKIRFKKKYDAILNIKNREFIYKTHGN